jgi:hypothetical protein
MSLRLTVLGSPYWAAVKTGEEAYLINSLPKLQIAKSLHKLSHSHWEIWEILAMDFIRCHEGEVRKFLQWLISPLLFSQSRDKPKW